MADPTPTTGTRPNRDTGVKTTLDGQGFDSEYNSRTPRLKFNLSHDNEGGFLLICPPGRRKAEENLGNLGTVVRYNVHRHDRARTSSPPRSGPEVPATAHTAPKRPCTRPRSSGR